MLATGNPAAAGATLAAPSPAPPANPLFPCAPPTRIERTDPDSIVSSFFSQSLDRDVSICHAGPATIFSSRAFLARAGKSSGHAVWPAMRSGENPARAGKTRVKPL
jgi:hypothetical protein